MTECAGLTGHEKPHRLCKSIKTLLDCMGKTAGKGGECMSVV
jgi:hypothetical protein